ncbi:MAG: acyl-CoA dehydrogenase [Nevskiaceae bacterium]|nr:MAG: acyl-CoA dehydrogenase [Nevskiaceae bacterium]TAM23605.1 MAG: acyl-CoA dehydrogenase [Nevskiaceae bacterium]
MNLSLNDDQRLIRESAESFLADASASAAVRAAMEGELGYDPAVWQRIAGELGWCGIAVPEELGGLGLGPVELALVQEVCGYRLLCAPFFSSACLASTLLLELANDDARAAWLPQLAAGEQRLSAPLPSDAAGFLAATALKASQEGEGWSLSGRATRLPEGDSADALLLLAAVEGEALPGLFLVRRAAAGLRLSSQPGFDRGRRFAEAELSAVAAERIDERERAAAGYAAAAARVRLYIAAEQLGAAQACLDLTVAYTATRKQFGRAIAGFQAIKHRCAEMMVRIEALRSAVAGAAAQLAAGAELAECVAECAAAKALASDTLFWCAQEAIQLHGGVGFTWEYDPQLYFKRAQASSHWLGTAEALRELVAGFVLRTPHAPTPALPRDAGEGALAGFREEIAGWMQRHLSGRYASLKHRGGPGDEEADPALRKEWERELAAGGWTGVGWPKSHGGRGLSIAEQVVFHEEYARAGGPGRMGHIGEGLLGPTLIKFGTPEQQQRFLPRILDGSEYWAQGYSEPNAGSDLANVQTRCWQEADGSWRVQGQKIWTSLAHESEWIFVLARSEPGSKGGKGLSFLLLPLDQPGIEIRPISQLGGGSEFNEVFFDGAKAEAAHLVGKPGEGWKVAMGLLEIERGVSTLGQQMHFLHELERVVAAARQRGLDRDPFIRNRIAGAWAGLKVLRYHALRMLATDDQLSLGREALVYKYAWSNWHRELGKLGMDVLAAAGEGGDEAARPLQQLFFFSRADTIYGGTNEIQLNLIAERGLGMPREARPVG